MVFFFLIQKGGFKLFHLNLAQLKNSSFLMLMVSFVTFQNVALFKGIGKRLEKFKRIQVGNLC
jgi:hypothetical protein